MKKDDIQLQLQGGGHVMDRTESNHSADTAKYEPGLDTSHDSGLMRQTGNHDLLVRGGHDHDQVSVRGSLPVNSAESNSQLVKLNVDSYFPPLQRTFSLIPMEPDCRFWNIIM